MKNINWIAVIGSVVLSMVLGFLWYGAFFNELWMVGNGIEQDGEKMFVYGKEVEVSFLPMIVNTIAMVIYAIFMNWLINKTGDTTWAKGAKLGAVLGIIMVIGIFVGNLFASKPTSLTLVDGSYSFVLFTLIGAIIGGWRNK